MLLEEEAKLIMTEINLKDLGKRWISVEDRLPERYPEETIVLVWIKTHEDGLEFTSIGSYFNGKWKHALDAEGKVYTQDEVLYWRELPEPPPGKEMWYQ